MPWICRLALMSWVIVSWSLIATRSARAQSCNVPSQCTQLAPVCNGGICVPCLTNHGTGLPTDCPSANQPYCWIGDSGSLGGSCTQCGPGPGNSALCDSTQPVCLSDGTCGCTETNQCASGFVCDQATQSCAGAGDAGAADAAIGDASSSDGATKEDAAPSNDASSGEGDASSDAEATDAEATDGAPNDAEAVDAAPNDAGVDGASLEDASGDGSIESDGAASDAEPGGSTEGGGGETTEDDGEYILGGGCACTTGPGGSANGAAALVALALACSSIRRRRGR